MNNSNLNYQRWNSKLRFQLQKVRSERDELSNEIQDLKSKCRKLELELSENRHYATEKDLTMIASQARVIERYAQMYSDLLRENIELKKRFIEK